jgi:arylsulfatase A-like enzyme
VDGKSVLPLIHDEKNSWRDFVHGEHKQCYAPENEHHFLTDGKWKYIWFTQTNTEQLFHLKTDPYEITDLAALPQFQEELQQWRERLITDLKSREAGLVENGKLVCQAGKPPLVSPHYRENALRKE